MNAGGGVLGCGIWDLFDLDGMGWSLWEVYLFHFISEEGDAFAWI